MWISCTTPRVVRQKNGVMSTAGLGAKNDYAGLGPAAICPTRPVLKSVAADYEDCCRIEFTLFILVENHQRFGGNCYFHLLGRSVSRMVRQDYDVWIKTSATRRTVATQTWCVYYVGALVVRCYCDHSASLVGCDLLM
jgi:hypothetical protein